MKVVYYLVMYVSFHFNCFILFIIKGVESFGEFFRISTIDEVRTRLRKRLSKARKRKENGEETK